MPPPLPPLPHLNPPSTSPQPFFPPTPPKQASPLSWLLALSSCHVFMVRLILSVLSLPRAWEVLGPHRQFSFPNTTRRLECFLESDLKLHVRMTSAITQLRIF
ncbi:hypothetical protein RRG08_029361 [Elysia crispata]|uniref:Uncharacterized protein n=1 Tax=Elysia crispata TaxID=231223 RepID=A0AAE1B8W4_9GAST|nr:hypothetical protein RRG08_029361 [Elysia crispata]